MAAPDAGPRIGRLPEHLKQIVYGLAFRTAA